MFGTGAIGIPGVLLVRSADQGGGGSEYAERRGVCWRRELHRQGARAGRAGKANACRSSGKPGIYRSRPAAEPRLDGLGDIPLKPWVSEKPKADEVKPEEANRRWKSSSKRSLPWDAVEPYRFSSDGAASRVTPRLHCPRQRVGNAESAPIPVALPKPSAVEGWVKAKATEIKGEDRGRSLLSFRVLA